MDLHKEVKINPTNPKTMDRDNKSARAIKTDKFPRIQSPSSINTFKQCPRKYYYNYIVGLETLPSIHLIRGKLTHSVLEDFFKVNIECVSKDNFMFELRIVLLELLNKHWNSNLRSMIDLNLTPAELKFYFEETKYMLLTWFKRFIYTVVEEMKHISLCDAFRKHTPITEEEFVSHEHGVRGFIDAIYEFEKEIDNLMKKEVHLIDYKTSKKANITEEYRLQLAIYAMLYKEKYGNPPCKVGLDFLKFEGEPVCIDVDDDLIDFAKREVAQIHEKTKTNNKQDYPKQISALCKWHSGQCDFYEFCKNDD